jgi:DtxR family manganese transport transcriptional regulator
VSGISVAQMAEKKLGSERAEYFKKMRSNRLFELAEDYTELIADLMAAQKQPRVCDIAREMGISHVSVLKAIRRLIREGYLVKDSSKAIALTPKGEEMAVYSKRKHRVLSEFLLGLGIPEQIVAVDVEGIEHYISPDTLEAIAAHMKTASSS